MQQCCDARWRKMLPPLPLTFTANYENHLCQNPIGAVLIKRIKYEFVMGRRWKNLTTGCFSNGELGWRSGESARLRGVFRRALRFSSPHKNSKFQIDEDRGPTWKQAKADVASSLNMVSKQKQVLRLTFNLPPLPGQQHTPKLPLSFVSLQRLVAFTAYNKYFSFLTASGWFIFLTYGICHCFQSTLTSAKHS